LFKVLSLISQRALPRDDGVAAIHALRTITGSDLPPLLVMYAIIVTLDCAMRQATASLCTYPSRVAERTGSLTPQQPETTGQTGATASIAGKDILLCLLHVVSLRFPPQQNMRTSKHTSNRSLTRSLPEPRTENSTANDPSTKLSSSTPPASQYCGCQRSTG